MEDAACHLYTVEAVHLSEKCSLPSAIKFFISTEKKQQHNSKYVTSYEWWLPFLGQTVANMFHCQV